MAIDDILQKIKKDTDFSELLNLLDAPVIITDHEGKIAFANKPLTELYGLQLDEIIGSEVFNKESFGDVASEKEKGLRQVLSGETREFTSSWVEYKTKDGELKYLDINIKPYREGTIITFHDFTEEFIEAIEDELTGCYTRSFYERHLFQRAVNDAERREEYLGMIMIDLKEFKEVNDKKGHTAGDHILQDIGKILRKKARPTDSVIRYGGDEFILLLPNANEDVCKLVVERIKQAQKIYNDNISDPLLQIKMNIGFYATNKEFHTLQTKADELMYKNKRQSQ